MLPYIIHHHVLFRLKQIKLEFQWVSEIIRLTSTVQNLFFLSV